MARLLIFVILIFSFFFTFLCGSRGFFATDQSIIFDGGYRILLGQVPYRDFYLPFGPVSLWLQGLFFKVLGVNYRAYLLHASILNLLFTLILFLFLKTLIKKDGLAVYTGTAIGAIFFYPQFGTPWFEQTTFFFTLISLYLLTR
ncbi:MAG TPA: hypothetical protein EYP24_02195, partial [bacterium (Candidatus Stahlbacteria)]|nr:hypothetical protein [Candidatus Stahlbacteria bacterium]